MNNKVYLKRYLRIIIILSIISITSFSIISKIQYNKYKENFNNKINGIINLVLEKNPDITKDELFNILISEKKYDNILKDYGYDLNNNDLIKENELNFKHQLVFNTILLITLWLVIIIIFYLYDNNKEKKIKRITEYIKEINKRNYKIDISDNNEDELSILKNELYKTTVMLRELADNSLNDKKELKKALEDISHQLKTPLTSIIIMLDNIIDDPNMDDKTKLEFIKDIKRESLNINFLVQSILKLSKFDVKIMTSIVIIENNDLNDIVKDAIKNISSICDLKNVKVEVDYCVETIINCDHKWQIEAISNVLKNAVEHSKEFSTVKIKLENNKLYAKVSIIDNGVGIDKEDLKHIFERFYKGKNSSKDSVGIGLALAKSIIEASNGLIDVKSKKDEGTIFEIKYFK